MNTVNKILLYTTAALGLSPVVKAQDTTNHPTQATLNYAAIELTPTLDTDIRLRGWVKATLDIGPVSANMRTMNQLNAASNKKVLNTDSYFGREVAYIGPRGWKTGISTVIKIDNTGIVDAKYGLSTSEPLGWIDLEGFIDIGANTNGINATLNATKHFGNGWTLIAFPSGEFTGHTVFSYSLETEVDKTLGTHVSAVVRSEIATGAKPILLGGISINL